MSPTTATPPDAPLDTAELAAPPDTSPPGAPPDVGRPAGDEPDPMAHRPGRPFLILWAGQTLSLVGTQVTGLGVSIIAYLQTGSLVWLAALFLAARLPGLLVSATAGALVDRASRKMVLLAADTVAGAATLAAVALHLGGVLQLWHLVVLAVVGSAANAFQQPAYEASVPLLVSPEALPRAHGFLQMASAAGLLVGPALAGAVVALGGVGAILALDTVTFLVAVSATLAVHIPTATTSSTRPLTRSPAGPEQARGHDHASGGLAGLRAVWGHLTGRRAGIRRLILWGALINFVLTAVNLLLPALLLSQTGESTTGLILSIGGAAMLVSSIVVAGKGLPDRRVTVTITAAIVVGLGIAVLGLRPDVTLMALGILVTLAAVPVIGAATGTIHQTEVGPEWQGRLTALRRVAGESLILPAALVLPPLVEWVAKPAMQPDGPLAPLLGPIFGTGDGRGIGLTITAAGLAVVALALAMGRDRALQSLDRPTGPGTQPDAAPNAVPVAGPNRAPKPGPDDEANPDRR